PSFFAREDTKTPMLYAGIAMVSTAVLSFVLFMAIGATGIAIATMLSCWINLGLLVATLKRRDSFKLDQTFRRRFAGICAASAVMAGVVFALVKLLAPWFAPASGLVAQAAALITLVSVGLVVYLAAAELFRATKIQHIIKEIGAYAGPLANSASSFMLRCSRRNRQNARPATPKRALHAGLERAGPRKSKDHRRRCPDLRPRRCGGAGRQAARPRSGLRHCQERRLWRPRDRHQKESARRPRGGRK